MRHILARFVACLLSVSRVLCFESFVKKEKIKKNWTGGVRDFRHLVRFCAVFSVSFAHFVVVAVL